MDLTRLELNIWILFESQGPMPSQVYTCFNSCCKLCFGLNLKLLSINGKLYRSLLSKVRNIVTYLDGIFIVHFVIGERETDSRERIERIQEMKSLYYHTLTIDYII